MEQFGFLNLGNIFRMITESDSTTGISAEKIELCQNDRDEWDELHTEDYYTIDSNYSDLSSTTSKYHVWKFKSVHKENEYEIRWLTDVGLSHVVSGKPEDHVCRSDWEDYKNCADWVNDNEDNSDIPIFIKQCYKIPPRKFQKGNSEQTLGGKKQDALSTDVLPLLYQIASSAANIFKPDFGNIRSSEVAMPMVHTEIGLSDEKAQEGPIFVQRQNGAVRIPESW
jgi:hypothetical protein